MFNNESIRPLIGKLIIQVQCDGCMAEDHKIKKVGRVIAISKAEDHYDYAKCLVFNSHFDEDEQFFYVCVQDNCLQQVPYDKDVYFHYI
jgi:hypothetical protein